MDSRGRERHAPHRRSSACRAGLLAWALASACALNPATGRLEFQLVSPRREAALGAAMDAEVRATTRLYGDPAVAAHVTRVGRSVAAASERPNLPWAFRVLDAPEVNAFAAPGGYVYVARDLLAHLQSDAELAAVLAHEVGHVAARHGARQATRVLVARRAVGAVRILDPAMRHIGALAAGSAYLSLLRHSREQELEADQLALRYLERTGRPPQAMAQVLAMLAVLEAGDPHSVPVLLSTHPATADRIAALAARGVRPASRVGLDRAYGAVVEGLAVGPDPRYGYLAGATYVHPAARLAVELPPDYEATQEGEMAVAAAPPGDLLLVAGPSRLPSAEQAHRAFFASGEVTMGNTVPVTHRGRRGLASGFVVDGVDGPLMGTAVFLDWEAGPVMAVAVGTEAGFARDTEIVGRVLSSLRPPTRAETDVGPMRLSVVRLTSATPVAALAQGVPPALVARINRVSPDAVFPAGAFVKLVRPARLSAAANRDRPLKPPA